MMKSGMVFVIYDCGNMGNTMIIAVPLFGRRIAPRFDYSETFLIVTVHNGRIENQEEITVKNRSPFEKIKALTSRQVNNMICGGINLFSVQQLGFHNINVFPWVTGEAREKVQQFINGDCQPNYFNAAGRGGRKRYRRGRNRTWGMGL